MGVKTEYFLLMIRCPAYRTLLRVLRKFDDSFNEADRLSKLFQNGHGAGTRSDTSAICVFNINVSSLECQNIVNISVTHIGF